MEIKFRKGDRVAVIFSNTNDSTNSGRIGNSLGVYSLSNWKDKIFEIEGEIQMRYENDFSYLLTIDGVKIGYVYGSGLKKITLFQTREKWNGEEWISVNEQLKNPDIISMGDDIYQIKIDGKNEIFKGYEI